MPPVLIAARFVDFAVQIERIGGPVGDPVTYWADDYVAGADRSKVTRGHIEAARIKAANDRFATGRVRFIRREKTTSLQVVKSYD